MSTLTNVLTDAVLAGQAGALCVRLRARGAAARAWCAFFGAMAVATAAGALRHALPDGAGVTITALLLSNLASGAAVLAAQRAALFWQPHAARQGLADCFHVQLGAFGATALLRWDFLPALANTSIGLGWVLATAAAAARRGRPGAAAVAGGLGLGVLAAAVYVRGRAPTAWFDHVDIAHALMIGAFALLYRGARVAADAR
jgi:hypothetical protein